MNFDSRHSHKEDSSRQLRRYTCTCGHALGGKPGTSISDESFSENSEDDLKLDGDFLFLFKDV